MASPNNQQPLWSPPQEADDEDIVRGEIVGSGRWEILDGGTRGGMATVFRARDTRTGGEVALKVIAKRYLGRYDREKRFENEARLASRLRGHRNIAAPIETGVLADHSNRMYLAMELLRGPTMLDYLSMNGPMRLDKAFSAVRDIARALRDLHASEVVHRDITTNNVILVETGSDRHTAKVIDFGLAADCGSGGQKGERLTRVGELPGTAHYMSPEQVWGQAAEPAFDVYALGIVFYEALVGEPPWHEMTPVAVKARKCDLSQPAPSVREKRRDIPEVIDTLITACLQPKLADRLPSATVFVARLDEIRASIGFVEARPGEQTGIVGLARTVGAQKREPRLKQILADAKVAKEARERARLQASETRPVHAVTAADGAVVGAGGEVSGEAGVRPGRPPAVITGQTAPVTAAVLAGVAIEAPHGYGREELGGAELPPGATTPFDVGVPRPRASQEPEPDEPDDEDDEDAVWAAARAEGRAEGRAELQEETKSRRFAVAGVVVVLLVAIPLGYAIWDRIAGAGADDGAGVAAGASASLAGGGGAPAGPVNAGAAGGGAGVVPMVRASAVEDSGAGGELGAGAVVSVGSVGGGDAGSDPGAAGAEPDGPSGSGADPGADPGADTGADPGADTGGEPVGASDAGSRTPSSNPRRAKGPRRGQSRPPRGDGGSTPAVIEPPPAEDPWTPARCEAERTQAMKDRTSGRFAGVLTHTRVKKCWPNKRERLELRVRAYSELQQYAACVKAGEASSDPGIARTVRRCRKKIDGGGAG